MSASLPLRKPRKPAPFKLTAETVREWPRHRQIADVLAIELAPAGRVSINGVCWFSIDLSSYMGNIPYTHLRRGVVAGVYDVFVLHRGRAHWLEVKADDGELSYPQRELGAALLGAGGRIGIARSAKEVLDLLDSWGIPRARRTAL
jgi:hypothetical protein